MRRSVFVSLAAVLLCIPATSAFAQGRRGQHREYRGAEHIRDAAHSLDGHVARLTEHFEREILSADVFWQSPHEREDHMEAYLSLKALEGVSSGFHQIAHDRIRHSYCALEGPFHVVVRAEKDARKALEHTDWGDFHGFARVNQHLHAVHADIERLDRAIDNAKAECRGGRGRDHYRDQDRDREHHGDRGPYPGQRREETLNFQGPWVIGGSLSYNGVRNRGSRIELDLPRGARVTHVSLEAHDRIGGRHGAQLGVAVVDANSGKLVSLTSGLLDVRKKGSRHDVEVHGAHRVEARRLIISSDSDEAWVQNIVVAVDWDNTPPRRHR